jgi:hypothetical protein
MTVNMVLLPSTDQSTAHARISDKERQGILVIENTIYAYSSFIVKPYLDYV